MTASDSRNSKIVGAAVRQERGTVRPPGRAHVLPGLLAEGGAGLHARASIPSARRAFASERGGLSATQSLNPLAETPVPFTS